MIYEDDDLDEMIEVWKQENKDDSANHDFVGDINEPGVPCLICGDNTAGLLHAFDKRFGDGYFDEPILDVMYMSD